MCVLFRTNVIVRRINPVNVDLLILILILVGILILILILLLIVVIITVIVVAVVVVVVVAGPATRRPSASPASRPSWRARCPAAAGIVVTQK